MPVIEISMCVYDVAAEPARVHEDRQRAEKLVIDALNKRFNKLRELITTAVRDL